MGYTIVEKRRCTYRRCSATRNSLLEGGPHATDHVPTTPLPASSGSPRERAATVGELNRRLRSRARGRVDEREAGLRASAKRGTPALIRCRECALPHARVPPQAKCPRGLGARDRGVEGSRAALRDAGRERMACRAESSSASRSVCEREACPVERKKIDRLVGRDELRVHERRASV